MVAEEIKRKTWDLEEIDDVSVHQEGIRPEEVDDGVDPLEGLCSSVARVLAGTPITTTHCQRGRWGDDTTASHSTWIEHISRDVFVFVSRNTVLSESFNFGLH